jgi:hypothetical protein
VCEENVQETIKTNIEGTTNIVNAAIENRVRKVIDVSSDKAVEPINLYGMTKAVGEKIIVQANDLTDYTKFVCIRGGNVMGSNGSVIPYFIEQIRAGGPITITDLEMTRFFLTLEEAITLLFKAATDSIGGTFSVTESLLATEAISGDVAIKLQAIAIDAYMDSFHAAVLIGAAVVLLALIIMIWQMPVTDSTTQRQLPVKKQPSPTADSNDL